MPPIREAVDLKVLFVEYIEQCRYGAGLSPVTIRGYEAVFTLFLKLMPEVTTVELLNHEMLVEFFKRLETRVRIVGRNTPRTGVKKSTIKTYWSKLNYFFRWLYQREIITINPLQGIRPPRVVYEDERALSDEDIHKIISAITSHSPDTLSLRRDMLMVYLLICSGVRLNEFVSLEVRDLDLVKRIITVRGETSKSKRTRYIPMHPTLLMHLKDYLAERNRHNRRTQFLIVSTKADSGLTQHGIKHWVESLIKKSGVKFHLHRFRHTFASKLATQDVSAFKIQKLMGHSSISMTARYVRSIRNEEMQEDVSKISI